MRDPIKYVLGLDIGIGSVGWAVVRCEGDPRIENFGVRIFESGENEKRKSRKSQERRSFRAGRRLVRRRAAPPRAHPLLVPKTGPDDGEGDQSLFRRAAIKT